MEAQIVCISSQTYGLTKRAKLEYQHFEIGIKWDHMLIPMLLLGEGSSNAVGIGQLSGLTYRILHTLREDRYDNTVDHISSLRNKYHHLLLDHNELEILQSLVEISILQYLH